MAKNALDYGTSPRQPNFTCQYEFTVQDCPDQTSPAPSWRGQGDGGAYFGGTEGLLGRRPGFELGAGWLTLFPIDGWTRTFPLFFFTGYEQPMDPPYEMRGLKSYAVHIGEALQNALRPGDTFTFSCNTAGDYSYRLVRGSEQILRAGAVDPRDEGGSVAVWQEYDKTPNPKAGQLKKQFPSRPVAEWIQKIKPYVTVRMKDQVFHLIDGQDAHVDPHYAFLARTTLNLSGIAFIPHQAVFCAGNLGPLTRELIRDAAHQLIKPQTRILLQGA